MGSTEKSYCQYKTRRERVTLKSIADPCQVVSYRKIILTAHRAIGPQVVIFSLQNIPQRVAIDVTPSVLIF